MASPKLPPHRPSPFYPYRAPTPESADQSTSPRRLINLPNYPNILFLCVTDLSRPAVIISHGANSHHHPIPHSHPGASHPRNLCSLWHSDLPTSPARHQHPPATVAPPRIQPSPDISKPRLRAQIQSHLTTARSLQCLSQRQGVGRADDHVLLLSAQTAQCHHGSATG